MADKEMLDALFDAFSQVIDAMMQLNEDIDGLKTRVAEIEEKLRKRKAPRPKIDAARIWALHQAGWSKADISRDMYISMEDVDKVLSTYWGKTNEE